MSSLPRELEVLIKCHFQEQTLDRINPPPQPDPSLTRKDCHMLAIYTDFKSLAYKLAFFMPPYSKDPNAVEKVLNALIDVQDMVTDQCRMSE